MKLLQNTIIGFRYKHWTLLEVFAYFLKGVAREIKIAPVFFLKYHQKVVGRNFKKKWLKKDDKGTFYFDLNGALLPDISAEDDTFYSLAGFIFDEVFLIPCFYNDNYDKKTVELFDQSMMDIPYCYGNGMFDVTIKKGDIVIDAGAWIGDFSAYAASKGADCYAFEPTGKTFQWLCKTAGLNDKIVPVQKGLGSQSCQMFTTTEDMTGVSNTIVTESTDATIEKIDITTLDEFVKENKLERIDFIKADIEGAEREMLKGATHVLQTFAPKLAICTYHLPDDPEALEKIIMEANPKYKVVHFRQKLFATVVE